MKRIHKRALILGAAAIAIAGPALATHSWGGYHWARTANPLKVQLGDNVNAAWDASLLLANSDWNQSTVIKSPLVPGSTSPKNCKGIAGTIQVCNSAYGRNGWLGIASISITGGTHITQGVVKLNDTYYNTAQYNTPAWRNMVMCQEIGHAYGLDHQDEGFDNPNLDTCMDYTNNPASNQHPNTHDYDMLASIYQHLDSTTTVAFRANGAGAFAEVGDSPATWGRPVRFLRDGRPDKFERVDGPGMRTITHVFWAIGEGPRRGR